MRVNSCEKRIKALKKQMPWLKVDRKKEDEWEIACEKQECKKEIEKILGDLPLENQAMQTKAAQIMPDVVDPIARPISDISSAFNSLSQIVLMQANEKIEALRQEVNGVKQKNEEVTAKHIEKLQEICDTLTKQVNTATTKQVERLDDICNTLSSQFSSSMSGYEEKLLDLSRMIDEMQRDKEIELVSEKEKIDKKIEELKKKLKHKG